MEDYAEELRTPPVALVSLVGVPELHQTISTFLHSEQPPINTLALPDFSKVSILARKGKDAADPGRPAAGILKREWLKKHRTMVPAVVAALFDSDRVNGDPAQWLQVCTDLDNVKYGFLPFRSLHIPMPPPCCLSFSFGISLDVMLARSMCNLCPIAI